MKRFRSNKSFITKRCLDIVLLLLLEVLMCFQYTGQELHEWVGTAMFLSVVLHNLLNIRWYSSVLKGKHTILRLLQIVVNLALVADIVLMMISGILMSGYVFAWLPVTAGAYEARLFHLAGAHWGYLLMSIHLGMHFGMMNPMWKKLQDYPYGKILLQVRKAFGIVVWVYGLYAFIVQNIAGYLFLTNQFYLWGTASNMAVFIIQNIAMLFFFGKTTSILLKISGRKKVQIKKDKES